MYQYVCKECNKIFENKHKNQIYCSKNCFIIARNKEKDNELINKKFGKLTVICLYKQNKKNKIFRCQCNCGNIAYVSRDSLIYNKTKSCGCLKKELNKETINDKFEEFNVKNFVENTSLSQLQATFKNNTSGWKGVCWDKKGQCWKAYIYFKNKRHHLCSSKDINVAIQARKKAEEKYFKPILDKYNKEIDK